MYNRGRISHQPMIFLGCWVRSKFDPGFVASFPPFLTTFRRKNCEIRQKWAKFAQKSWVKLWPNLTTQKNPGLVSYTSLLYASASKHLYITVFEYLQWSNAFWNFFPYKCRWIWIVSFFIDRPVKLQYNNFASFLFSTKCSLNMFLIWDVLF